MRTSKVTKDSQLQFRAEGYNVVNHTNYNSVDTKLGDGTRTGTRREAKPRSATWAEV